MEAVVDELPVILGAFWLTVKLTVVSGVISLIWGIVLAAMRVSPLPVLRGAGALYVNVLRNTPLTLIIVFCGLGLGTVMNVQFSRDDLSLNSFWLSIIGLSAYTAAFVCEVVRSGINTVPLGQAEAARAIGLTFLQTLRLVILPQAVRTVIAPLGSLLNALVKNTTVAAAIGVMEAALRMKNLFDAHGDAIIPIFLGFAAGFVVLTLPMNLLSGRLARRLAVVR
ncbi:amino acid ABC transporter permease [Microbispora bryophytorum]|uniref:Amino acid ABC transporter permease n=2 Tax=Microbispora bryophytorum TaxID=1460882 RepID=A0ABR8L6G3_9ACTN|nr:MULTISPECIES: amino acid ABC transporter permease [Microbispora]MBD3135286.1 amino acid ABC transporter permease [Microbispora bryophytorum]MBD3144331.1 amino acid ABC transporter permease [Microbispora camponoti]TQS08512.1 amino acid ABC transporter permease [Microbispora bryophytorum]GGO30480.1 putative glutamate ABC transporter, permease [Microbispora bryophytorum]